MKFVLLPGQRHDLIGADPFLSAPALSLSKDYRRTKDDGVEFEALIADRAYDSNALRDELEERGATVVIPPRSDRVDEIAYDVEMYKACPRESGGGVIWWRISLSSQAVSSPCDAF